MELIVGRFLELKIVSKQIIEDTIRQFLSQNVMFNSKEIQKELDSNHEIFLIRLLNNHKIERYGIFVFSSNSIAQTFKSSDGNQRKMSEGVQSCKQEQ